MARSQHSGLACSFCQKPRGEVRKLIAGPGVHICNECVDLCNAIFAKNDSEIPALVELGQMTLLDFLRQFASGRAVDSITVSELWDAIMAERKQRLSKPRAAPTTPEHDATGGGRRSADCPEPEEDALNRFLASEYGIPAINLGMLEIDPDVTALVPEELQRKYVLVPVNRVGSSLIVAMADPSNVYAIDDLKFMTNLNVEVVVASRAQIRQTIDKHFPCPH